MLYWVSGGHWGAHPMTIDPKASLQLLVDEFEERLREAAYVFEHEPDGRFDGPIHACAAVYNFLRQRDTGAELAGPFAQSGAAFKALKSGGKPTLFSKK